MIQELAGQTVAAAGTRADAPAAGADAAPAGQMPGARTDRPDPDTILAWLAEVPDPEIPVISVVDLGIVRAVRWVGAPEGDVCEVTITPTYSGCPATAVIAESIEQALAARGLTRVRLVTRIAPAWTTDWLSQEGRRKLAGYGIVPPQGQAVEVSGLARRRDEPAVHCPRCDSARTRLVSRFGSTPCKSLYQCMACREPFDYFKSH